MHDEIVVETLLTNGLIPTQLIDIVKSIQKLVTVQMPRADFMDLLEKTSDKLQKVCH